MLDSVLLEIIFEIKREVLSAVVSTKCSYLIRRAVVIADKDHPVYFGGGMFFSKGVEFLEAFESLRLMSHGVYRRPHGEVIDESDEVSGSSERRYF